MVKIDEFFDLDLNTRKLCTESVRENEKALKFLCDYYESLNEEERYVFEDIADEYYYLTKQGSKKFKITQNGIYIAKRIKDELGISCYPVIEKIATKGWSTSDGTFAWSMRKLMSGSFQADIHSFEPVREYRIKDSVLNIGEYNSFSVVSVERKNKVNLERK